MKHRWARIVVLLVGLLLPQAVLIGPSLIGQKILLPLELLKRRPTYLPPRYPEPSPLIDFSLGDLVTQLEPNRRFAVEQVRSGRLPLWNPYNYCGAPFLASNQPAIFSPFRLIDYLWPSPIAIAWGQLIRVLVAGVGAYLYFRRALRLRFLAAAIGAWCFPLGGFLTLWAGHPIGWEVTWLPLLLWATDLVVRRPRGAPVVILAALTAFVLVSGHSATGVQMLLLDVAYALWSLCRRFGARELLARRGLAASAAVSAGWAIGCLLSLPQTLPTLEYMQRSARIAERERGSVEAKPQGLEALPPLVLPFVNGFHLAFTARLESAAAGYAGLIVALILAPLGWQQRRLRPALIFWGIAAVVGIGQQADVPLLSLLYRAPLLNTLRNNRLVFITGFGVLTCAAVGIDWLLRRRRVTVAWWMCLIVTPLSLGLFWVYRSEHLPSRVFEVIAARPGFRGYQDAIVHWFSAMYRSGAIWCGVALLLLALIVRLVQRRALIVAIVGAVAAIELIVNAWNLSPQCDPALYYPRLGVVAAIAERPPGRICGLQGFPPNLNLIEPLPDIRGYDAADPILLTELLQTICLPGTTDFPYARTQSFIPAREMPVLDLLNLRYLLMYEDAFRADNAVWTGDGYTLIERPTANTRAMVPRFVRRINESSERLARIAEPDWNPRSELILEVPSDLSGQLIEGKAIIVRDEPMRVEIRSSMQTKGYVLLADQWDPGWHATVNGAAVRMLKADHAFRAVEVPAGESAIEFTYAPESFRYGLIGAGVGGMAILVMIVISAIRMRFRSEPTRNDG